MHMPTCTVYIMKQSLSLNLYIAIHVCVCDFGSAYTRVILFIVIYKLTLIDFYFITYKLRFIFRKKRTKI